MRASKIFLVSFAAALAFGVAMGTARADQGAVINVKALGAQQQAALVAAIQKAHSDHPEAFTKVAGITTTVAKLDREKRGRFASISRQLFAVGKTGLMPMLEMLAVKGPTRGKLTDTAWTTLRVGLIEVVGMHRDPVAIPVLDAILDKDNDFWVTRAAAEALARIGDDSSAQKLVYLATTSGPKQAAVLSGIGDCRRTVAAKGLAAFSRQDNDYETTKLTLKALGGVGNSWAWKTPAVKKTGEEAEVRSTAAQALVEAFARLDDAELRRQAQMAILVVDDPSTPALIASAKSGASAETRAALDKLAAKFAHSPLHKYE